MSARVVILVPHGSVPEDAAVPDACSLLVWHVGDDVVRTLAGIDRNTVSAVVLGTDGLLSADLSLVVEAVRRCGVPVVEVRGEQWDGFERLELAQVCKGVASGFGVDAVRAIAVALGR
ncbi:MAG: hypothetical protein WD557_11975 [Dehalococcoidia bacterium]